MTEQVDECELFFQRHRGGSGAVVVVYVYRDNGGPNEPPWRTGIFGSIETAQEWRRAFGDDYTCVIAPYIVDDPDWGNEADTRT